MTGAWRRIRVKGIGIGDVDAFVAYVRAASMAKAKPTEMEVAVVARLSAAQWARWEWAVVGGM